MPIPLGKADWRAQTSAEAIEAHGTAFGKAAWRRAVSGPGGSASEEWSRTRASGSSSQITWGPSASASSSSDASVIRCWISRSPWASGSRGGVLSVTSGTK